MPADDQINSSTPYKCVCCRTFSVQIDENQKHLIDDFLLNRLQL